MEEEIPLDGPDSFDQADTAVPMSRTGKAAPEFYEDDGPYAPFDSGSPFETGSLSESASDSTATQS